MSLRVDCRASLSLVGTVLKYLAVPLSLPTLVAIAYGESTIPFLTTIALTVAVGYSLERLRPNPDIGAREGFLMVSSTWLAVALVGMVPYLVAAHGIPFLLEPIYAASTLANPVNALFETMSGFTTTGATVLGSISVEDHTYSIMLWRQLTQWLGGMGIVVLAVAILPELSVGGAQLMDAEAPGPGIEKLTPKIAETARVLWGAYLGITLAEIALLYGVHLLGMAPSMDAFNAVAHGLTTMPTGGFSPQARSIEAFSAAAQWVIIPFMAIAGTNFALVWHALSGSPERLWKDTEFRAYMGAVGVLTAILTGLLFTGGMTNPATIPPGSTFDAAYVQEYAAVLTGNVEPALRHALFQALTVITTTGYASMDFDAWSEAARYVLLFGMFIGGSAGSTGGAVKIIRWIVIAKAARRELFTTAHPEAVRPVRLNGNALDDRAIRGIVTFTLLYLIIFFVGSLLLFLDAVRAGVDLTVLEVMAASASTLGNVGPAFYRLGPMGNYLPFSDASKLFMLLLMWAGRLEILPLLVCLTPEYWRR
ncbi:cation transporter [halophilic archaeon DL31]|nr:cation transporter [halophilic archaeon DL31]